MNLQTIILRYSAIIIIFILLLISGCGGGSSNSMSNSTITTANAGTNQYVTVGDIVTLDASDSTTSPGKILTYTWSFISRPTGSTCTLSSNNVINPTFTPDIPGSYLLNLVVNDGILNSEPAYVTINATETNIAPVAIAASPQNVITGSSTTLDGSNSNDPNGDTLTYIWSITSKPPGSSTSIINNTSQKPTITPDVAGIYTIALTVNDGKVSSSPSYLTITAENPTLIGGIISSNTTWSKTSSPYKLVSNVQVAPGVTLTIEPGVTIYGDDYRIELWGTFDAVGTTSLPITINDTFIYIGTNATNSFVNIDRAKVTNGSIYNNSNYGVGSFSIKNSTINNSSIFHKWYPLNDSYLEYNVIINTNNQYCIFNSSKVHIKNNVFLYNNALPYGQGYAVDIWWGKDFVVKQNSFLTTNKYAVGLAINHSTTSADANLDVSSNYWNTTDVNIIKSMIFDKTVDLNSPDYIQYLPYLTMPDPNTPDPEPYL